MAFSWNPDALSRQGDRKAGVPPQASVLTPCPLSALEGAEPRQAAVREREEHPRLFAPLLTGHWHGASAPSSALSEAAAPPAGAPTGSPAGHRSYLPGYDDPMAAASLSALTEGEPWVEGAKRPAEARSAPALASSPSLSALSEQGAPRPTEDGASTPPCSLSASSPYPMRRRRALLFGSVRAW